MNLINTTKNFDYKGYQSRSKYILGKIGQALGNKKSKSESQEWNDRKSQVEYYKAHPKALKSYGIKSNRINKLGSTSKISDLIKSRNTQLSTLDHGYTKDKYKNIGVKAITPLALATVPTPIPSAAVLGIGASTGIIADKIKESRLKNKSKELRSTYNKIDLEKSKIKKDEDRLLKLAEFQRKKAKLSQDYKKKLTKLNQRYRD